jgi:NTE family protein
MFVHRSSRVALVLGAGGPVGHAFHAGALLALWEAYRWDPRRADLIVGTSAGAQVGALLRAGLGPADLKARITGAAMTPHGASIARHYTRPDPRRPGRARGRRLRPASLQYVVRTVRRPWSWRPGPAAAALLPEGRACLHRQAAGLRRMFDRPWPDQPLWVCASHLDSGRRVVFGHHGAPHVDVGTAVISSGAVPGVWEPVSVEGHRYVDGGIHSPTHLDLVAGCDAVDAVIVSSPLSRFGPLRGLLRTEQARLWRQGTPILVLEPCAEVMSVMGYNPMDPERAPSVARAAYRSVFRRLASQPPVEARSEFTCAHS